MTTRRAHRRYLLLFSAVGLAAGLLFFIRRAEAPKLRSDQGESARPLRFALSAPVDAAPAAIRGSVRRPDGRPIEHARVCATRTSVNVMATAIPSCTGSAADGRFELLAVPPGSYWVAASADGFAAGQAAPPVVTLLPKSSTDVVIALTPQGKALSGTVVDAAGGPVPLAELRAVQWSTPPLVVTAKADSDGAFTLWLPHGSTSLTASADGYAPASLDRVAPARGVEIVLAPGAAIEGVVLGREGREPVPGASVIAALAGAPRALQRTARADDDGKFKVTGLEPGSYELRATAPGARGLGEQWTSVELGEVRRGVELLLDPAVQVEGKVVVGASGAACTHGGVTLGPPSPEALLRPGTRLTAEQLESARAGGPMEPQSAAIEPDGQVHFDAVPQGRYFVSVECADHTIREGPEIVVVAAQNVRDLLWRVEPGLSLDVLTVDGKDQPAPGATVWLDWPSKGDVNGPTMPMPMSLAGRYRTPADLLPGRYLLRPDGQLAGEPVTVDLRDGMGTVPVTVRLTDSALVEVQVTTRDGAELDGLRVSAALEAESSSASAIMERPRMASSLGAGRYQLNALKPGRYRIEVSDGINPKRVARSDAAEVIEVVAGAKHSLTLSYERGASITGRVIEADGAAASDVWVSVSAPADGSSPRKRPRFLLPAQKRVLTDNEGNFRLEGLMDGANFRVRAERPDGSAAALADNVAANGSVELRLKQPGSLQGRVVRADRKPEADYFLQAFAVEGGTMRSARFSEQGGRFVLDGVPPGPVQLTVTSRSGEQARSELVLSPGQKLTNLEIVLAEPARREHAPPPALRAL